MPAFFSLGFDATLLGFEYALLAVGVYVSFKILNMADLTVDGSFGLGLAISATLSVAGHPYLGIIVGALGGAVAGCVTGLIATRAKINPLLAGIITMTGLYSINMYVLGGPNVSLLDAPKVYMPLKALVGRAMSNSQVKLVLIVVIVAAVVALLAWFFKTETGLAMRATGDNEEMCRASSINTAAMQVGGLALANALVGATGAILAQYQGYADINSGTGMVMIGLASVIIGEVFGGKRGVTAGLVSAVVGSVVYRIVLQLALSANLIDANALKLITAVIVCLFMATPAMRTALSDKRQRAKAQAASAKIERASHADDAMLDVLLVNKTFNPGTSMEHQALRNASVSLPKGTFACVVGSNGAGKSTLFNAIAGSIVPDSGQVRIAGTDVTFMAEHKRAHRLSRVFQDPMKGTAPHLTVAENIALAYGRNDGEKSGLKLAMRKGRRAFIKEQLAHLGFGLEERLDTKVGLLSGGQRQAVTLLMATIAQPDVLLLDEHTAALDPEATARIFELTERICKEQGITTMMITHDLNSALTIGDCTLVMDDGQVVANISAEERAHMSVDDLLARYKAATNKDLADDKTLLV